MARSSSSVASSVPEISTSVAPSSMGFEPESGSVGPSFTSTARTRRMISVTLSTAMSMNAFPFRRPPAAAALSSDNGPSPIRFASVRSRPAPMTRWIGGLDGCRGAWAGVLLDLDDPARFRAVRFARPVDLLDGPEAPIRVGIDCPIGLDGHVTAAAGAPTGRRALCSGAGRASVFPVPARAAVYAATYEEAKALSRAHSTPPFAPSIQCWNIFGRPRGRRTAPGAPELMARLTRSIPRSCSAASTADRPLAAGKKGPARQAGLAERRALLAAAGLPEGLIAAPPPRDRRGRPSRCAGRPSWSPAISSSGRARPLPDPPGPDDEGLPIVIWMPAAPRLRPGPEDIPARAESEASRGIDMTQDLTVRDVARALVFDPDHACCSSPTSRCARSIRAAGGPHLLVHARGRARGRRDACGGLPARTLRGDRRGGCRDRSAGRVLRRSLPPVPDLSLSPASATSSSACPTRPWIRAASPRPRTTRSSAPAGGRWPNSRPPPSGSSRAGLVAVARDIVAGTISRPRPSS